MTSKQCLLTKGMHRFSPHKKSESPLLKPRVSSKTMGILRTVAKSNSKDGIATIAGQNNGQQWLSLQNMAARPSSGCYPLFLNSTSPNSQCQYLMIGLISSGCREKILLAQGTNDRVVHQLCSLFIYNTSSVSNQLSHFSLDYL